MKEKRVNRKLRFCFEANIFVEVPHFVKNHLIDIWILKYLQRPLERKFRKTCKGVIKKEMIPFSLKVDKEIRKLSNWGKA